MKSIGFCFSGYVNNGTLEFVTKSETGERICVEEMDLEELEKGLKNGDYLISLEELLCNAEGVEIFDIEVEEE